MKQFAYTLTDPVGIHARPAALMVKAARQYKSRIMLQKDGKTADMARMMSVMGLGAKCGDTLTVTVEGEDEDEAAEQIKAFLAENL